MYAKFRVHPQPWNQSPLSNFQNLIPFVKVLSTTVLAIKSILLDKPKTLYTSTKDLLLYVFKVYSASTTMTPVAIKQFSEFDTICQTIVHHCVGHQLTIVG